MRADASRRHSLLVSICAIHLAAAAAHADDWPQWRGPDRNGVSHETGWLAGWQEGSAPPVAWHAAVGKEHSSVSIADGRAYTMGWDGAHDTLFCFDAANGELLWRQSYPCATILQWPGPRATPTIHDGAVYTLDRPKRRWVFNQSPLFLEFLRGNWDLECTPWGSPTYNIFGWQKPCYLLQEGYAETFEELLESTDWDSYGRASGNSKCADCMVHCGYEPTAVHETFNSLRGLLAAARVTLLGPRPARGPIPEGVSQLSPQLPLVELEAQFSDGEQAEVAPVVSS